MYISMDHLSFDESVVAGPKPQGGLFSIAATTTTTFTDRSVVVTTANQNRNGWGSTIRRISPIRSNR